MRTWVITLGFAPSRIWWHSAKAFYATKNPGLQITHVFVDQHYPLKDRENRKELYSICSEYGIWVLDPGKNLGLHGGFNWAMAQLPIKEDDVVIGYDPDSHPISPGWDMALVNALEMDQRLAWTSLMSERAEPELIERGYEERQVGHLRLWITKKPVVNSVCAWRKSFLTHSGGLCQPGPLYGGLEADMWHHLQRARKQWAFLPGWREDDMIRNQQDKEYLWYKWKHAHLNEWPGDFASYVAAGCPEPSDLPKRLP